MSILTRAVQTVITALFFRTYFEFVDYYHLYQNSDHYSYLINPLSFVNEYDHRGIQAIHHASIIGHFSATKTLIEDFGADINARTTKDFLIEDTSKLIPVQSTPLIISIITGNYGLFFLLLSKRDLDINLSTDEFKSPLHFAAEYGELTMIEALLDYGAKITFLKGTRKSPFYCALENGRLNVIEWFIDRNIGIGPVVSRTLKILESNIHYLARLKLPIEIWLKSLEICLKHIQDDPLRKYMMINKKTTSQMTPLHCAMSEENESAIVGLILNGADGSDSKYPLIIALNGFFQKSDPVISPDYINFDNETIWHLIARINLVTLAKGIIYYFPSKPNLRLPNRIGQTALELAVEMENFDVAFEFIKFYDHQIDPDLLEKFINFSVWNFHPKLLEKLINEFENSSEEIISKSTLCLHILATSSLRGDPEESKQMTLVLIKKFPQIIKSLDKQGRTSLHIALQSEFWDFFNWLHDAKIENPQIDFNVQDDGGNFFFDLLKEQEHENSIDILNLLNFN